MGNGTAFWVNLPATIIALGTLIGIVLTYLRTRAVEKKAKDIEAKAAVIETMAVSAVKDTGVAIKEVHTLTNDRLSRLDDRLAALTTENEQLRKEISEASTVAAVRGAVSDAMKTAEAEAAKRVVPPLKQGNGH